jgi:hypothetical protein
LPVPRAPSASSRSISTEPVPSVRPVWRLPACPLQPRDLSNPGRAPFVLRQLTSIPIRYICTGSRFDGRTRHEQTQVPPFGAEEYRYLPDGQPRNSLLQGVSEGEHALFHVWRGARAPGFPPPSWGRWFAKRSGANRRGESARESRDSPHRLASLGTSPTMGEENRVCDGGTEGHSQGREKIRANPLANRVSGRDLAEEPPRNGSRLFELAQVLPLLTDGGRPLAEFPASGNFRGKI